MKARLFDLTEKTEKQELINFLNENCTTETTKSVMNSINSISENEMNILGFHPEIGFYDYVDMFEASLQLGEIMSNHMDDSQTLEEQYKFIFKNWKKYINEVHVINNLFIGAIINHDTFFNEFMLGDVLNKCHNMAA